MLGMKYLWIVSILLITFLGGILLGLNLDNEIAVDSNIDSNEIPKVVSGLSSVIAQDSPQDRINENDITIYRKRVSIDIEGAILARFADTKSMEPVITKDSNAIEIVPKNIDEIEVGDIISYESKLIEGTIIHRVVEKGHDAKGIYLRTKGDNLKSIDPEKIRPNQIKRLVIGILY